MTPFDARAWLGWLLAALAAVFVADHPAADLIVIIGASAVALSAPKRGRMRLGPVLLFVIGFVLVRVVVFSFFGTTGSTVLMEIPSVTPPPPFDGISFGGALTAEELATNVAEGARVIAVLFLFAAFLSVVATYELLRLTPRFLFEAGLVVNIALAFAPQLSRNLIELREAQAMRGSRKRREALRGLVIPLLARSLERSVNLAESMESRGYGAGPGRERPTTRILRLLAVVSALVLVGAGGLWASGRSAFWSGPSAAAAAFILVLCLIGVSSASARTRYRRRRMSSQDWTVVAVAAVTAVASVAVAITQQTGSPLTFPPAPVSILALLPAAVVPVLRSARTGGSGLREPAE